MQNLIKMVGALAILGSLPGSEVIAQHSAGYTLSGEAMKQDVKSFQPRFAHPTNAGAGVALGNQLQGGDKDDKVQREDRTRIRQIPTGKTGDMTGDIVPGAPFVVYVGDSANNPILLLDAGIVPEAGLRVLDLVPTLPDSDQGRFRDLNVYFRQAEIIVCIKGRDALQSFDKVALQGPGSLGLQNGKGAHLIGGSQSLTLSGQAGASADGDDDDDTGRTRDRQRDADATGMTASAGQQAAP